MDNNAVRQMARKQINWYGSTGVPPGIENINVLARVENITPELLENSVLRIDALIRMFVVTENSVHPDVVGKKIVKDVETSSFIPLNHVESFDKIVSIHHDINVERVTIRMGRVSAVGTLTFEINYLGYVVLEGTVTEFPRKEPVRGAQVNIRDIDGKEILQSVTTDSSGKYIVRDLIPGSYRVIAEAEGFEGDEKVALVMLRDQVNFVLHRI